MCASSLAIKDLQGLTNEEAEQLLKVDGPNELAYQKKHGFFAILLEVIKEPLLLLLICCGLLYTLLGEIEDALMLLSFVIVVVGITFYQERKTKRALEALKNLSSPRALVIRDGQHKRIAGSEVVRGDLVVLREGDRVPADGVLIFASNLHVDESLLTGEALAVRKTEWNGKEVAPSPGGDDHPYVFSGTLIVGGHGVAKITAVGTSTEMGKIGKALEQITTTSSPLQKETAKIVRNFTFAGILLCLLVLIIYGQTKGSWSNGFLAGLTLSMAMLPEEFPVVLLIFMTLGAWRMSKHQVLTRRSAAIETLGAATVLCVDKTGTLTQNQMQLCMIQTKNALMEIKDDLKHLPEDLHDIVEYAILASQKDPFDPLEKEILRFGGQCLTGTEHIHHNWKLVHEYALSKHLFALSNVWESPDKQNYIIAAKGSPESIADLCHVSEQQRAQILQQIKSMAKKGLRIIGIAKALFSKTSLPKEQHDFEFEFIGLLGFNDPVRPTVPAAISQAYRAGIRVIMITGDYPGTAQNIAQQIGLQNPDAFITGPELSSLAPAELQNKVKSISIFARVVPEQKLLLVNALKANGEIVAMTGDGVNDAPALKASHIGIAMGERGTDVAREAADLVLLDDDFSSIVGAVRMGRRIFDNLKKAMAYIFSVHVPIAGLSFLPVLLGLPLILLPAHIAFLELIIDPACSTVFEADPEETNIMKKPPRSLLEPLFSRQTLVISLLQGLSVLAIAFIIFLLALRMGTSDLEARTLSFATLVFANLMLIITNLSWKNNLIDILRTKNQALWCVALGAIVALSLVIYLPILRELFHFSILHLNDLTICLLGAAVSLVWFEVLKFLRKNSA